MNRTKWRELRVHWNTHEYLPIPHLGLGAYMWRLDTQKTDKLIMTFKMYNIRMLGMVRNREGIYNLRTRPVSEMGVCSQVAPMPVSPIFINTCHWCNDEPGTSQFEGHMYCRDCCLDAMGRQARAQLRKEENLRLKVALMMGIFLQ